MFLLYIVLNILFISQLHSTNLTCYNKNCFITQGQELNYTDASKECKKLNLSLGFVENRTAQLILKDYVNSFNESFYIGLKYIKNHRFIWDCNSPHIPDLDWSPKLKILPNENCAYLLNGTISFGSCDSPRKFICSNKSHSDMPIIDAVGSCPKGFFRFQNKCYKMNLKCKDPTKNWTDAQNECRSLTPLARLMTPDSMIEEEFLTALMTKSPHALWTGFVKLDIKPEFYIWINGNDKTLVMYPINFNKNEPNNGHNERCLMSYHRLYDVGQINDEDCSKNLNYLCEAPLEKENRIGKENENSNPLFYRGKCKENYYEFNETCYFVDNQTKPYESASVSCHQHLLNVYGYIDVAFIRSLMSFQNVSTVWVNATEKVGSVNNFNQGAKWLIGEMELKTEWLSSKIQCYYISSMTKGLQEPKACSDKHSSICYYFLPDHETNTDDLFCPLNWIKVGTKCFKLGLEILDFTRSRDQCRIYNGKLATLKNMKEVQAIGNRLTADAWIGLTGLSLLNNTWIDGTNLDYCLFRHTKDVNRVSKEILKQKSFILRPKKYEWVLRSSNQSNPFICEQAALKTICPKHIPINIDGDCYGIFNINKTWDEAERHCQFIGGNISHLASFHSLDQQSIFFSQINDTKPYWLGLRMYDNDQHWIDNTPINYQLDTSDYSRRFPNDVNCFSSNKVSSKVSYIWTRRNCALKLPFICKVSNNTKNFISIPNPKIKPNYFCPKGFVKHDLSCFKIFSESRNWTDADQQCKFLSQSATCRLARFQTNQELESVLSSLRHFNSTMIWIGLMYDFATKQYVWVDEKPFDIIQSIGNYDHNIPQVSVAMEISSNPYKSGRLWKHSIQKHFPFICRIDPHETFIEYQDNNVIDPFTSLSSSRCPSFKTDSKHFEYNNHCYSYTPNKLTFNEANKFCNTIGPESHLLTIDDTFEEHFIRSFLKSNQNPLFPVWLGLEVIAPNFVMNWTTTGKADVYYTHWSDLNNHEIDMYSSNPKEKTDGCAVLQSNSVHPRDGMGFIDCSNKFPFICKTTFHLHNPSSNACAISENGTAYLLDVNHTRNNESCARWDLVTQKDPYSYHTQTSLFSSLPLNNDGYLSYSLQRCSEFKNEDGFHNYSCYVLKEHKYYLQECEMVLCQSKAQPREKPNFGHPFIIILFVLLIVAASGFLLYVYRGSLLSNYRVREFLANVLGRFQPDCLRYPSNRSQGTVGGTGFVNPIYTPLETRY